MVESYNQIADQVDFLRELANSEFIGNHKECLALHHSQVSQEPYNFFALSKHGEKLFPHWLIINPKIIDRDKSSLFFPKEGCMSYPFRKLGKVRRYGRISVQFHTYRPGYFRGATLKESKIDLEGLAAEIFQHEFDHSIGKYIYE